MAITINGNGTISGVTSGAGKVLQMQQATSSTTVSGITSETLLTSVSITPLSSTSSILLLAEGYLYSVPTGNPYSIGWIRVRHGSTAGTGGTDLGAWSGGVDHNTGCYLSIPFIGSHSPGATNQIIYSMTCGKGSGNTASVTAYKCGIFAVEVEA